MGSGSRVWISKALFNSTWIWFVEVAIKLACLWKAEDRKIIMGV
jgi:hypothetical protein